MDWTLLTWACAFPRSDIPAPKPSFQNQGLAFPQRTDPPPMPMPSTPAQMQAAPRPPYNLLAMEGPKSICAGRRKNNNKKIAAAAATIY